MDVMPRRARRYTTSGSRAARLVPATLRLFPVGPLDHSTAKQPSSLAAGAGVLRDHSHTEGNGKERGGRGAQALTSLTARLKRRRLAAGSGPVYSVGRGNGSLR